MGRQLLDAFPVADMVADGLPVGQISAKTGACIATVANYLKKHGLKARHASAAPKSRDEKIVSMHRQGINMAKIAGQLEITRERVRQILAKKGITAKDGGDAVTSKKKAETKLASKQAACLAKHGLSLEAYRAAVKSGLSRAFLSQRKSARGRGIEWGLRFAEWLSIWEESGKLELRGRGIGHYCMSRVNDAGGYELGNVHIQLCTENSSEYMTKNGGRRNANTGVYLMYPGLSKPWSVRIGRKFLGNFVTEEQATAARDSYLSSNPGYRASGLGHGKGWTLQKNCRSKPYLMQATGAPKKSFATAEEAEAAYRVAVAQVRAARQLTEAF